MKKIFWLIANFSECDLGLLKKWKTEYSVNRPLAYPKVLIQLLLALQIEYNTINAQSHFNADYWADFHLQHLLQLPLKHHYLNPITLEKLKLLAEVLIDFQPYEAASLHACIINEMYMALETYLSEKIKQMQEHLYKYQCFLLQQLNLNKVCILPNDVIVFENTQHDGMNYQQQLFLERFQLVSKLIEELSGPSRLCQKLDAIQCTLRNCLKKGINWSEKIYFVNLPIHFQELNSLNKSLFFNARNAAINKYHELVSSIDDKLIQNE